MSDDGMQSRNNWLMVLSEQCYLIQLSKRYLPMRHSAWLSDVIGSVQMFSFFAMGLWRFTTRLMSALYQATERLVWRCPQNSREPREGSLLICKGRYRVRVKIPRYVFDMIYHSRSDLNFLCRGSARCSYARAFGLVLMRVVHLLY